MFDSASRFIVRCAARAAVTLLPLVTPFGVTAQDAPLRLRYSPLAAGEKVLSQAQDRVAFRGYAVGTDTVPAEHTELATFRLLLTEWLPSEETGGGQARFTVLADETRKGVFLDEIEEHVPPARRFTVARVGDSVTVTPERAATAEVVSRVQRLWATQRLDEALGRYLDDRRFVPGEAQRVPDALANRLMLGRASLAFERVETRWQRRVARFRVDGHRALPGAVTADVAGTLYVDSLTGRPLQLGLWARAWNGDSLRTGGLVIGQRGVTYALSIWEYSTVPLEGHRIAVVPQGAPRSAVSAMAVSADARTLAVLTDDGQLAFWDATVRRVTSVQALDAVALAFTDRILVAVDGSGFVRGWLVDGADAQAFGRSLRGVRPEDPTPTGLAMSRAYAVVAYADGQLNVRNLGYDQIMGWRKVVEGPILAIAANADGRRLAVVDSAGRLVHVAIDIDTKACGDTPGPGWCEGARLGRLEVTQVDSIGARGATAIAWHPREERIAVATERGELLLWQRGRPVARVPAAGRYVAFSPDGETLRTERGEVSWREGRLRAHESVAASATAVAPAPASGKGQASQGRAVTAFVQSPTGDLVFIARRDGTGSGVDVIDAATGTFVERVQPRTSAIAAAALDAASDGRQVTIATAERNVSWDLASLRLTATESGAATSFAAGSAAGAGAVGADLDAAAAAVARRVTQRLAVQPSRSARPLQAVSRAGRLVATTQRRPVASRWNRAIPVTMVLDATSGRILHELPPRWGTATTIAFSDDEAYLAVGYDDGRLLVYDIEAGVLAREFNAHSTTVTDVAFLPSGRRVLSTSQDGTMRLWDLEDAGALLLPRSAPLRTATANLQRSTHAVATFVAVEGSEPVVITADGYYMASPGALRGIALVNGDEAFDFERYDRWLNRPDIVAERVGLADREWRQLLSAATARRIASLPPAPGIAALRERAPELTVQASAARVTTSASLTLDVSATAKSAALQRLIVRVNSVPLDGPDGRALTGTQWVGRVEVPLGTGANRIQVTAIDADGHESPARTVVVSRSSPPRAPDLYVLAVGVSAYRDATLRLAYAAKDANDLVAALRRQRRDYGQVHVRTILDADATREGILAARSFLQGAGVDDEVIVFFAGHGFLDARLDYYFGTADVSAADPARRGLAYRDLLGLFDGLRARKRLLLLDTCHAGEVDREAAAAPRAVADATASAASPATGAAQQVREFRGVVRAGAAARPTGTFALMRDLFADLGTQAGATVLSAAGGAEYAMESERWNNGVFTFSLLEGLEEGKADLDTDGRVTVTELERYVSGRVVELTRGRQRPNARQRNLDLDFALR